MYLDVFDENPYGTNCWLIAGGSDDEAVVVDPGFEPERVWELLRAAGRTPVAVLATHAHADHIGRAGTFCGGDLPLFIHEADRPALEDPGAWNAGWDNVLDPVADVRTIVDGDRLRFAGCAIEVWHTPGHTPGSCCFLTDGLVLSGDLVFAGTVGRSDFPNSSPVDMRASLARFLTLADRLPVLPGHGPRTTVGRERATNPFLQTVGG
jgi:hydroxyacylglutathione hydrolase